MAVQVHKKVRMKAGVRWRYGVDVAKRRGARGTLGFSIFLKISGLGLRVVLG
ncbi:hypothetical protein ERO13_A07G205400v2 [Gossypium hirsutum]|uniref:Uncharacterized protein n=4 Tax=Gossypium TaxID=3633 RepID=A0A5J5V7X2_GOSBA|nr:hypothetical protein ES319_A07G223600v1 [Gossypium barbadense]KAG4193199.1 hypothetical protein ERO13_A07G205400v2 [Gossypium hirsutum]TYH11237.1 hypothetical protein ES288_A07G242300v1 [Gossypium darwinii]TYI20467.1 hypothetical protein ES332_A07G240000v1 [Gossypium tomentosum]TYJ28058.1 hypothetical protein E1A91_A07G232000v1 [Gossypium mustelinum]